MKTRYNSLGWVLLFSLISTLLSIFSINYIASHTYPSALAALPAADAPVVLGVDPSQTANDLAVPVVITGANFTSGMTVTLGNVDLPVAGWVNSSTLTATIPWGLDAGVYTLTVTNPDGLSGSLTEAFTVTQGLGVWTTGGPFGGEIRYLFVHPNTPGMLYAGTWNSIFRSLDAGDHWELINVLSSITMGMSPAAPDTLYVTDISGYEILRTDDGGDTWQDVSLYEQGPWINATVFPHPTISDTVYLGISGASGEPYQDGAFFVSTDWGENWITQTQLLTDARVMSMAFDPVEPLTMVVGTVIGNIFQSGDGGVSWDFIGQPEPGELTTLSINPFGRREVWAVVVGHLWKQTPGLDWQQFDLPYRVDAITFDPVISGTLWLGTSEGAYRSIDGGDNWESFGALPRSVLNVALDPFASQSIYLGYRGDGVYKTSDGGTNWEESNNGLTGLNANSLAIDPFNLATVYASVNNLGVLHTADGGATWRKLPLDFIQPWFVTADPAVPDRLYVGVVDAGQGGVSYSEDGGEHWQHVIIVPPLSMDVYCVEFYNAECQVAPLDLAADASSPGLLVLAVGFTQGNPYEPVAGGIYFSDNYGETWSYVNLNVGHMVNGITTLAVDPFDSQVIYAGASAGLAWSGIEVLKSSDGGQTWQTIYWGEDENGIHDIVADPDHPSRLFRTWGGIERSDNGGLTWTSMPNPPFGSNSFHGLAFIPDASVLYASTSNGLYRSDDGAFSWQTLDGPLAEGEVSGLAVARDGERVVVYASTAGSLVEARSIDATLVSGGVYRITTLETLDFPVYLPMALKNVTTPPCDQAAFVMDVTIPDGTQLNPGTEFIKTWRLRNAGSCTWTTDYTVVFDHGDQMGGPASQPLTDQPIIPGETVDISISLVAPSEPGTYQGYWSLMNDLGILFGLGDANDPFFVLIEVVQ